MHHATYDVASTRTLDNGVDMGGSSSTDAHLATAGSISSTGSRASYHAALQDPPTRGQYDLARQNALSTGYASPQDTLAGASADAEVKTLRRPPKHGTCVRVQGSFDFADSRDRDGWTAMQLKDGEPQYELADGTIPTPVKTLRSVNHKIEHRAV